MSKLKHLVSVGDTVVVELLARTHADKHMANVLPNHMRWQSIEILVTDITEVNPASLRPSLFPSSNYINSPANPPLTVRDAGDKW